MEINSESLYAIEVQPHGTLACWNNSQGVPFLSSNRQLVQDSIDHDDDCLAPLAAGHCRTIVEVYCVYDTDTTVIVSRKDHRIYSILRRCDV